MIAREGFAANHKKVRRIYTEEKLRVRRRGSKPWALTQARFGPEKADGVA
jgi:putative transposase